MQPTSDHSGEATCESLAEKREYASPQLTRYGDIRELTQAGGLTRTDNVVGGTRSS